MRDQDRLIRRVEVERLCALSTSSIYRLMGENRFPRPIRVGPKAVRWRESDIDAWVETRPLANGGSRRSRENAGGLSAERRAGDMDEGPRNTGSPGPSDHPEPDRG